MNATKKTTKTTDTSRTGGPMGDDAKREYVADAVEVARKQMVERCNEVLKRMERSIDDAKRYIADYERGMPTFAGPVTATNLAEHLQHEILWLLPNLGLDNLTELAAETDGARRNAEKRVAEWEAK